MRIFFLASLFVALLSCNNDLNTIGDTMIPAEGFIEIQTFEIAETSTVRLDSFPTDLYTLSSVMNSGRLTLGHIKDLYTGEVTATPYFQIVGNGIANIDVDKGYVYDSLTMNFPFDYTSMKLLAGDTVNMQTYTLHRLSEYPQINYNEPAIFNTDSMAYNANEPLAKLSMRLDNDYFNNPGLGNRNVYFKLSNELGRELFNRMQAQDPIFERPMEFIRDFIQGLTIVPASTNTALIPIDISKVSLTCHYHAGSDQTTGSFSLPAFALVESSLGAYFSFTNIKHTPAPWLEGANWQDSIPFSVKKQAVVQGMNGYALKVKLPYIANNDAYKTILKAEIVLKPIVGNAEDIPELKNTTLQIFSLDRNGRLRSALTDISGNSVTATLQANPDYQDSKSYVIDITDYYNSVVTSASDIDPQLNLLIGLVGVPKQIGYDETLTMIGAVATTFDRVVIDETPILRIYYANYK